MIDQDKTVSHYIAGERRTFDGRKEAVVNPATGAVAKYVEMASSEVVDGAVAAAANAFPVWRNTPPIKRARILFRFKSLLERDTKELAALITEEHGKTADDALGEVNRGIEIVEYACGAPQLLTGDHAKNIGPSIDSWSEFQPLGVVAGVTPFNFPAMAPMWMFPIAIACGNTFILKPSERDPSASIKMAELAAEAGLPPGVLNVVNGDRETVEAIVNHPDVKALSFVGSTPVAESLYRSCSAQGKRVQALGGAKNHAIVMPDADVDNAANALMGAAFGSCGERCMAISVAVCVGDRTADAITEALKEKIGELRVGPGHDPASDMGPLITKAHMEKVRSYVYAGVEAGAALIVDGRDLTVQGYEDGNFLGACLFDRVTRDMSIYQEEIFGPVLCVVRVSSQEEAMKLVEDHQFGNGACIFTSDGEAARYFSDNIEVGMAGVNVALPVPAPMHSFGGWKQSLFGDLHAYGPDGVRFYTRRKTVTQRWPVRGVREAPVFNFPSSSSEKDG